jgi:hypothetical protein
MERRVVRSGNSIKRGERRSRRYISAAITEVLEPRCLLSTTVFVDHTATGLNNGTSWANAYTSLQTALTSATGGTTIDVAAGTYSPGSSATNTFTVPAGVTIDGGFANGGAITAMPNADPTILSGGGINNHVMTVNSGTDTQPTVLDGLTITGGNADGSGTQGDGGGLFVTGTGGAARTLTGSVVTDVVNCSISGNTATGNGGGIENRGAYLNLTDCIINGDSAGGSGGGLDQYYADARLVNSELEGDSATEGGGIYNSIASTSGPASGYSYATAINCDIVGDTASVGHGGAIAVQNYSHYIYGYANIANSIVYGDGPNEVTDVRGTTIPSTDAYDGLIVNFTDIQAETTLASQANSGDNLNTNPLFLSSYSNLQLQASSPVIGQASVPYYDSGGATDLAGNARETSGTLDMGALEHQAAGVPAALTFSTQPTSITAGGTVSPVVDVDDIDGDIVATDESSVTIQINTGPAGAMLNGSLTMVTVQAVNGVATFSPITLDTAGSYTLTASDASDNLTNATSGTFTVAPGSAFKLGFPATPSAAAVGVAISPAVVVDVEDQFGNVVSSTDSITISVATGTGTLNGTTTVSAAGGAATFSNLSLSSAGTYSLTATDNTNSNLTPATSGTFTVGAATASKLVFATTSGSGIAGNAISPSITVDVENIGNTIVGTDNSTVTLGISTQTSTGTLSGTLTAQAVNGVATFSNVVLNTSGNYTFSATDGTLTAATSGTFSIAAANASQLVFVAHPGSASANTVISPAIVVDVEDQFGNIVAGNTTSVTISKATGPGTLSGTTEVAAINGVATFSNLELSASGTYILAASESGLTAGTSGNLVVNPQGPTLTPSKLVFASTGQPLSTQVDAPLDIVTVYVETSKNQVVTIDSSTVTLSIHSGAKGAVLAGTVTATAVNGTATFSGLSINEQGAFTLRASDSTAKVAAATSKSFSLSPILLFSGSNVLTTETAGVKFNPPVVVDLVGFDSTTAIPNGTGSVKLTLEGPGGKLLGSTTVGAKNGVATFSKISVDVEGTYTLMATSSKLSPITSGSFTVVAANASKLIFGTQPNSTTLGTAENDIEVGIVDKFDNLLSNDDSDVLTLTLSPTGTTTILTVVNGIADFSGVTVGSTGTFKFVVTTPLVTKPTTSKTFKITA